LFDKGIQVFPYKNCILHFACPSFAGWQIFHGKVYGSQLFLELFKRLYPVKMEHLIYGISAVIEVTIMTPQCKE